MSLSCFCRRSICLCHVSVVARLPLSCFCRRSLSLFRGSVGLLSSLLGFAAAVGLCAAVVGLSACCGSIFLSSRSVLPLSWFRLTQYSGWVTYIMDPFDSVEWVGYLHHRSLRLSILGGLSVSWIRSTQYSGWVTAIVDPFASIVGQLAKLLWRKGATL